MLRKIFFYLSFCLLFFNGNLFPRDSIKIIEGIIKPVEEKIQGFLGAYHPFDGTIYGGFEGWNEGELIQKAFAFGENAIISQASYAGYTFKENIINNCLKWNVNKVYGILRPPTEKGKINQPGDTLLMKPFQYYPGMIQGAHRFSELSKRYPQICGLIIDDLYNNYPKPITIEDMRDIKDALLGKRIDKMGNVDHSSKATTPNLKLYIVVYNHELDRVDPKVLSLVDGVSFWIYDQNDSFKKYDNYIETINKTYPGKEIISGVYVLNGRYGEIKPESIHYLLTKAVNLYDKGKINGLLMFAPIWMSKARTERQRWIEMSLPPLLEKTYYKFLGKAQGKLIDKETEKPVSGVTVSAARILDNKNIIVSRKLTDSLGVYSFGAWAGESDKLYEIEFEKSGHEKKIIWIKLKPESKIILPDIEF